MVQYINHDYYPYGGIFGEGLASSVQPYKFGGKELDRMNGLDWSDFGARMLDSSSGLWGSIDPMADKYYATSPYAYCVGNPILYVDPNGEDVAILHYDSGLGHIGILVQRDDSSWAYYSVNGNNVYVSGKHSGGRENDDIAVGRFDSPQEFMDSDYNTNGEKNNPDINSYGYEQGYIIKTTPKQDEIIRNKIEDVSKEEPYNILTNNCATAVQKSLNAAGIETRETHNRTGASSRVSFATNPITPPSAFRAIVISNPNGTHIKKSKK